MTSFGHQPAPRRSNASRVVLLVFLGVAGLGFLLAAVGFIFGVHIGWSIGLLFFVIGIVGSIVSSVVWAATAGGGGHTRQPAGPPTSPPAGWYPDPQNPAVLRYFDGRVWTSSTQPSG